MTSSNDEYAKKRTEAQEKAAKAVDELRKEENEKLAQDYQKAQMLKRQMDYAMAMEELRKKHLIRDERGNETTRWEEVDRIAEHLMNSEQNSFHDFRSAMMSLLNAFGKLGKAIATSREQTFGEYYNKYIYERKNDPLGNLWIQLKSTIRDKIKGNGDIELPNLLHHVSFKDGKLDIAPLTRKDGAPLVAYQRDPNGNIVFEKDDKGNPKLDDKGVPIKVMSSEPHPANEAFKALIEAWLIQNDYQPAPGKQPGDLEAYVNSQGEYLDAEAFNRLQPSLAEFLNNPVNADLTFEDSAAPSPGI